jgi:hypothetical protein
MLQVLHELPSTFQERGQAVQALVEAGTQEPVAQWMALNLVRDGSGWKWRISAPDMEALILSFFQTDAWDVVESPPRGLEVHMVKAEESNVLGEAECTRNEEAGRLTDRVHLHRLPGGHWVNADSPDALASLVAESLSREER